MFFLFNLEYPLHDDNNCTHSSSIESNRLIDAENKPVAVDQAKSRVEQLDAQPEQKMQMMSQKEYIWTMETNHENLRRAWDAGERVQALKIAIQSAKLLLDISVPAFYPSAFTLIAEILDTFGNLVYDRIKKKGMTDSTGTAVSLPGLLSPCIICVHCCVLCVSSVLILQFTFFPSSAMETVVKNPREMGADTFTPMDVNPDAKETCKNWFYKTACIRELLPRLYIEIALLKCYRFIMPAAEFPNLVRRLSRMIRGIGDPLCAHFARAYLVTRARDFLPRDYKELIYETFNDFLFAFKQVRTLMTDSIQFTRS
jgi:hypothetical protein